jgi:pimeloyl-ACP methyl ester carboxylesterase
MATFLIAHGAWSAGWAWKKMPGRLRAAGHDMLTPSYTGMGERSHLVSRTINLETHVTDILAVLHYQDLHDVILVGHSYGGMVASIVADRARERLSQLVYVDAFIAENGKSVFDLQPPERRERMQKLVAEQGDGWLLPANPMPPDTPEADQAWAVTRRRMQPVGSFEQPAALSAQPYTLPVSYIYCTRTGPDDVFGRFVGRARQEGWQTYDIDASHNPHITAPDALAKLFVRIAAG